MSGLADIQETLVTLQQIKRELEAIDTQTIKLRSTTVQTTGHLRELEYISYRVLSLMGRMGLPERIDAAIGAIQQLILTIRMLHSALVFLEATTPYGWVMAGITLIGVGITANDLAQPRW